MRLTAMLAIALMVIGAAGGATVEKVRPFDNLNQFSPLQTWEVTLETDASGNDEVEYNFDGLLYSVDVLNLSLDESTNVSINRTAPYDDNIITIDTNPGNNTTYPRDGTEMFVLMGLVKLNITGGADNSTVPVYLTVTRGSN